MIEITYGELRDVSFARVLAKLSQSTDIKKPRTRLNVAKIYKEVLKAWKETDERHTELLDFYAEKNEDGSHKMVEGSESQVMLIKETAADYKRAQKEFEAGVVKIDRPKVLLVDLANLDLTPLEMAAFDEFLDYEGYEESEIIEELHVEAIETPEVP